MAVMQTVYIYIVITIFIYVIIFMHISQKSPLDQTGNHKQKGRWKISKYRHQIFLIFFHFYCLRFIYIREKYKLPFYRFVAKILALCALVPN